MIWLKLILTSAVVPPLLGAIYFFYVGYRSGIEYNHTKLIIFVVFAYWFALLVGVPMVLSLYKARITSLRSHVFFGLAAAVSAFLLLCLLSSVVPPLTEVIAFTFIGSTGGVASWFIVRQ